MVSAAFTSIASGVLLWFAVILYLLFVSLESFQ